MGICVELDAIRKQGQFDLNLIQEMGGAEDHQSILKKQWSLFQLGAGKVWSFWLHHVFAFISVQTC